MFESDDFDQVLSQFEFPEDNLKQTETSTISKCVHYSSVSKCLEETTQNNLSDCERETTISKTIGNAKDIYLGNHNNKNTGNENQNDFISPKHVKRKIIHSYFDHKSKRKFPGPAGILNGSIEETKDESICQIELLSQDTDFTQNSLNGDIFQSPLWVRLLDDLRSWNLEDVDSIKSIKHQALTGSSRRRKAHMVTAFVEAIDRSATDPLIIMRDSSGNIKGTLHRDVWSTFCSYIASEYCALVLWKPTILTTGGAFKKHYLNITLSNILAIYSSAVLNNEAENKPLPDGYNIVYSEDYTVIKTENALSTGCDSANNEQNGTENLFEELDSIFSDEVF